MVQWLARLLPQEAYATNAKVRVPVSAGNLEPVVVDFLRMLRFSPLFYRLIASANEIKLR